MKLLIIDIFGDKAKSEMTSYLNNDHDAMNHFAKFEKFIPHSVIIPSSMTIRRQMS